MKKAFDENGGGFKGAMAAAWSGIKSYFTSGFQVLNKLTGGKLGEIKDQFINKFREVINSAKTWGQDIINNLVQGIKDKINAVKDAVGNIASTIKDFLGFSEPDKGPLSNFHTFMPDMIDLMTQGIDQNMYKVTDSMDALASRMVPQQAVNINYNDSQLTGAIGSLGSAIGSMNSSVTVVLEGDAKGLFKAVKIENNKNTRATGRNAFA